MPKAMTRVTPTVSFMGYSKVELWVLRKVSKFGRKWDTTRVGRSYGLIF